MLLRWNPEGESEEALEPVLHGFGYNQVSQDQAEPDNKPEEQD